MPSLTELYLGCLIKDITHQTLLDFFKEEIGEDLRLEFKSYHSEKDFDNAYEAICAFANSEGGLLIFGAPIEKRQEKEGVKYYGFSGDPMYLPKKRVKDNILDKVYQIIRPVVSTVQCEVIECGENKSILVFEVGVSIYKPHQFKDKYYMRLDGRSKPAYHYLIEAMMKQQTYPKMILDLKTIGSKDFRRFDKATGIAFEYLHFPMELIIKNLSFSKTVTDIWYNLAIYPGSCTKISVATGNKQSEVLNNNFTVRDVLSGPLPSNLFHVIKFDIRCNAYEMEKSGETLNITALAGGLDTPTITIVQKYKLDFESLSFEKIYDSLTKPMTSNISENGMGDLSDSV